MFEAVDHGVQRGSDGHYGFIEEGTGVHEDAASGEKEKRCWCWRFETIYTSRAAIGGGVSELSNPF